MVLNCQIDTFIDKSPRLFFALWEKKLTNSCEIDSSDSSCSILISTIVNVNLTVCVFKMYDHCVLPNYGGLNARQREIAELPAMVEPLNWREINIIHSCIE